MVKGDREAWLPAGSWAIQSWHRGASTCGSLMELRAKPSGGVDVGQVWEKAWAREVGHVAHRPAASTSAKSGRRPGRGGWTCGELKRAWWFPSKNHQTEGWFPGFTKNRGRRLLEEGTRVDIAKLASKRSKVLKTSRPSEGFSCIFPVLPLRAF